MSGHFFCSKFCLLLILALEMKGIKLIAIILWKIWFALLTSVLVIIIGILWVYPLSYSARTFPLAYKGIYVWAWLVFYGSGFRMEVIRNKKLEKHRAYIFISNHTSILDIMVMAIVNRDHPVVFVGKEELTKFPIFGTIYKRICITVDRSDTKSRTQVFKKAKKRISDRESIVIFPEGGIADDRSIILQRFKDGPFVIAAATKTPIAVYCIKGLKEMFPEVLLEGYPGKVRVELLDIITEDEITMENKDEVKKRCYEMIRESLSPGPFPKERGV